MSHYPYLFHTSHICLYIYISHDKHFLYDRNKLIETHICWTYHYPYDPQIMSILHIIIFCQTGSLWGGLSAASCEVAGGCDDFFGGTHWIHPGKTRIPPTERLKMSQKSSDLDQQCEQTRLFLQTNMGVQPTKKGISPGNVVMDFNQPKGDSTWVNQQS